MTRTQHPAHVPADRIVDFDIYGALGSDDLFMAWKTLQSPGGSDIIWTPHNGGHWIATRYAVLDQVFSDFKNFSSKKVMIPETPSYNLLPHTVDPPDHRGYRALLNSSLSPAAIKRLEERMRNLARQLIGDVLEHGRCDFMNDYASILPIHIFLNLLELPTEDAKTLKRLADPMTKQDEHLSADESLQLFRDYLEPWIEGRTGGDGQDLISKVVNGKVGGQSLTNDEAKRMLTTVLVGGLDTVVNELGFIMLFLARNPSHRRELAANPALIPAAVDEFLRRFPVVSIGRCVAQDVEIDGVLLKQGDMILAPSLLGGLDDRANDRALEIDFHRSGAHHVTFGAGHHQCPGSFLARTEIRVTLEEWLKQIPEFEVASEGRITFTSGITATLDELPLTWDVAATKPSASPAP